MKPNIVPTQREIELGANDVIVSKTDLQGRIPYANRKFMQIADYSERDLIGIQHNIIRHPDMPRGAFKLLWDTLKAEREFFGLVKNMTSDGGHYWVFANITPDRDANGKVIGYFSFRRKPKRQAIAAIEPIYREMLAIEQSTGPAKAPEASVAFLLDKLKSMGTTYDQFILSL